MKKMFNVSSRMLLFGFLSTLMLGTLCTPVFADAPAPDTAIYDREFEPNTAPAELFLRWARRSPSGESWAQMEGEIQHHRRGQSPFKHAVYLASRFSPTRAYVQLVVDTQESYTVTQSYNAATPRSTIVPTLPPNEQKLPFTGIAPDDMTLSFLYWDYRSERPRETVKLQKCRVFELGKDTEFVRVWITVEHGFPIQCRWFKQGEKKHYRSLEVSAFAEQEKDLWVPTEFTLDGPGWRTVMKLPERKAGKTLKNAPANLFRTIPAKGVQP